MFPQLDKEKMAQIQQVSSLIRGQIKIDHKEHTINIAFSAQSPEANNLLKKLVPQFAEGLAQQLGAFFNIKGEIVDVNK